MDIKCWFLGELLEKLILPIPLPPLLIDLCAQITTLTAIGGVRNNHPCSLILFRLTAEPQESAAFVDGQGSLRELQTSVKIPSASNCQMPCRITRLYHLISHSSLKELHVEILPYVYFGQGS